VNLEFNAITIPFDNIIDLSFSQQQVSNLTAIACLGGVNGILLAFAI